MALLTVSDLRFSYADNELYDDVSFQLNEGEHAVLVGHNGSGKSTLLKLLTGKLLPDKGKIEWTGGVSFSYLDQELKENADQKVIDYLYGVFSPLFEKEKEMERLYEEAATGNEKALNRAARIGEELLDEGFYSLQRKIGDLVDGLAFPKDKLESPLSLLSSGQREKAFLAKMLLEEKDVLLLDEPTNYLDANQVKWLIGKLNDYPKAFLCVSHDQAFLREIARIVFVLENRRIDRYRGAYEHYEKQRALDLEQYEKNYAAQQRYIKKEEEFIKTHIVRATSAMAAKSHRARLSHLVRMAPPQSDVVESHFSFPFSHDVGEKPLIVDSLEIGYDGISLLEPISFVLKKGEKIAILGQNGVGKTTLAEIIARMTKASFIDFSAVTSGIKEIKSVMEEADKNRRYGVRTILFIDEIHRFNRAQQDAFLPYVEKGSIVLIGATTENPSFEVNGALLSRCKVFVLNPLSPDDIVTLLKRALVDPRGLKDENCKISDDMLQAIANFANGDARTALSTLEMCVLSSEEKDGQSVVSEETVRQVTSRKSLLYDKKGDEHYNLISALHKSMRNSDPDAAIYWLARMLEGGEDPLYVARRVVRFAAEDVGLADPRAVELAVSCYQACHYIGMPECSVHLAEIVTYLSLAPKSNSIYLAYEKAKGDAEKMLSEPVPLQIRNAPTKLMKELDYGKGYVYAHDTADKLSSMECLPPSLKGREYYAPTEEGLETRFKARLEQIKKWKEEHGQDEKSPAAKPGK